MKSLRMLWVVVVCFFLSSCAKTEKVAEGGPSCTLNKGINISHWLSQSSVRGEKRAKYFTREDVEYIASLGYDHLRIPIDEEQMFTDEGVKEAEAFQLLNNALQWCKEFNLNAVVDLHILRSHYFNADVKPLFTDPKAQEQFYNCWRAISGELKEYPNSMVAYELMNEPVADEHETWNVIVNHCAEVVRELEPERTIIIGSNLWQGYETVQYLRVPENDPNILISFHYYNPFILTHYRAGWTDIKDCPVAVHYPGQLITDEDFAAIPDSIKGKYSQYTKMYDAAVIEEHFKKVLDVANAKGLKVYCGEYGAIHGAPEADRIRWYKDMSTVFNKLGIARANWDYKGGFGIVRGDQPQTDMINALLQE